MVLVPSEEVTTNLGRVSLFPRGQYSEAETYNRLDLVQYNDRGYVAKKDGITAGTTPDVDTDDWMLLVGSGSADLAEQYAQQAEADKTAAEQAKQDALAAQTAAENAQHEAESARDTANSAKDEATTQAEAASGSATAAAGSADEAESWANQAQSWAVGTGYPDRENQEEENSQAFAEKAQAAQTAATEAQTAAETAQDAAESAAAQAQAVADKLQELAGGDVVTSEELATAVEGHNTSPEAHADIREKVEAATSKHWDIEVTVTGWQDASTKPAFGGITAQYQNSVTAEGMTADTDISGIVFTSGDRASASTWAWLAPSEGNVTLYAVTKPSATFGLRLTEVK